MLEILSPNGAQKRMLHTVLGYLGQLFQNFDDPVTAPKGSRKLFVFDETKQRYEVFDNVLGEWIPLDLELYNNIPETYTFAPKPETIEMELDYFVRGAGLLKHNFVWAVDAIPPDIYRKVRSGTNQAYRGRYTLTPWLPQIAGLGRMECGFYSIDEDDWQKTFGN